MQRAEARPQRIQNHPLHPQANAMPVARGFVNNIVNQFSDSDSILALLEETHGPEESSLEETGAIEEAEETAAAIYASYTSRLAQLDGAHDDVPEDVIDGGADDPCYSDMYSQHLSGVQTEPTDHHNEVEESQDTSQDSGQWDTSSNSYQYTEYEEEYSDKP